jgi:hypothetical protein
LQVLLFYGYCFSIFFYGSLDIFEISNIFIASSNIFLSLV